jgi:hypothetical protein
MAWRRRAALGESVTVVSVMAVENSSSAYMRISAPRRKG